MGNIPRPWSITERARVGWECGECRLEPVGINVAGTMQIEGHDSFHRLPTLSGWTLTVNRTRHQTNYSPVNPKRSRSARSTCASFKAHGRSRSRYRGEPDRLFIVYPLPFDKDNESMGDESHASSEFQQ